ncbi:hypothetical protein [Pseudoxanthomonas mexicana]
MFNHGKRLLLVALTAGLAAATGGVLGQMPQANVVTVPREKTAKKGKPKSRRVGSRFTWQRWRVPAGGGAREVARRRRQIENGVLLSTEGHQRLRDLRRGRFWGFDPGKPGDDMAVVARIDQTGAVAIVE